MARGDAVRIRRVGFRNGTDEDLLALHAVEIPVAAECGSHRMPRALDSYIAYARNLPSQFDDHAWLAEDADGSPVAAAFCWSNSAGDERVMECDVLTRRDRRREGIGSKLLAEICHETTRDGRCVLTWSTFDAVPAGEAFARRVRAIPGRVNRESELALDDVDWGLVDSWEAAGRARPLGYQIEFVEGELPENLRDDAVTFHHIMQTAPRDDLDVGDVIVGAAFVAELDHALIESGRSRWTIFVRDVAGRCVGGTELTFDPSEPSVAFQQNTGIDPANRGLGLAKWAKAAMLDRLREERPSVERVRTGNAFSNGPMLGINDALGFRTTSARTEWQADPSAVLRALSSRIKS
jgi:GNAT superfamily N-acetyltransferase